MKWDSTFTLAKAIHGVGLAVIGLRFRHSCNNMAQELREAIGKGYWASAAHKTRAETSWAWQVGWGLRTNRDNLFLSLSLSLSQSGHGEPGALDG